MRLSKVLAGFAVLTVAGASSAHALVSAKYFWNRCTPGAVRSCVSLQVFTQPSGTGTLVQIWVRNEQGNPAKPWLHDNTGGSIIRRLGLVAPTNIGATPSSLVVTTTGGTVTTGNPAPKWKLATPGGIGGLIELQAGVANNNDGGVEGCQNPAVQVTNRYRTCNANSWVILTFTTTGAWNAKDADVAWFTASYKVGGHNIECDANGPSAGRSWCQAVTPEPVTMMLLGSGLAGVGGFGFAKRKKNNDVEKV